MEDPTKVQGTTKSKGLRLTQYNDMFRMLKQIGSSFALLPQEDLDEAMSRIMQLVKLAQNREVQPEQQVQPDQQV